MIAEVVEYLVRNKDVSEKVENGFVSLIGVSKEEQKVIVDAVNGRIVTPLGYWM